MSFKALMDELGLMAKAQNDGADGGDGTIDAAAAADGGADAGAAAGAADAADAGAADAADGAAGADDGAGAAGDGDADDLGKSFSFKLDDGNVIEAIDGTALIKAVIERQERNEADVTNALGMTVNLIKSLQTQVGSLQEQISKLASSGAGRKAVLSVSERPSVMRKSVDDDAITPNQFMAKAMHALAEGRITSADVSRAEAHLNRGLQVPAEIVARVAAK